MTEPNIILARIRSRTDTRRQQDIESMKLDYEHVVCVKSCHFRQNESREELFQWMKDHLTKYAISNGDHSVIGVADPIEAVALKMVWG